MNWSGNVYILSASECGMLLVEGTAHGQLASYRMCISLCRSGKGMVGKKSVGQMTFREKTQCL